MNPFSYGLNSISAVFYKDVFGIKWLFYSGSYHVTSDIVEV